MAEAEVEIGTVTDFFARPVVAGIELTGEVQVGDTIRIRGHTTDLELRIGSMQVERQEVTAAQAGRSIGVKVPDRVRRGDRVYKVVGPLVGDPQQPVDEPLGL